MHDPADELSSVERAIAALEEQRVRLGDAVVETAIAPLLERRERLVTHAGGEQRKLVTILFSDLVGFTAWSAHLDAEDVRTVVNEYFATWRTCIESEGGVVEKYIGDAVMAVFGLHRAREDDAHRAVRAALQMTAKMSELSREAERRYGSPLLMRTGIDTGEVVVSALDDRPGQGFSVVGDAVNRASRLEGAAPPGGTLLSSETCLLVRGAFALQKVEGLSLKGIDQPVDAYLVLAEGTTGFWPETRGVGGLATRTVGRHLDLGRLQKVYADVVADGTAAMVTILGDAGVGKSRLVHELETWLASLPDEVWLLRGRASPTTSDVPNALLRSVFAGRFEIEESDSPEIVRRKWEQGLAPVIGDGGEVAAHIVATWLGFELGETPQLASLRADPRRLQQQGGRHLLAYLQRLAGTAPVVVLLEDLHWADDATLDGIDGFLAASEPAPVMTVATSRPELLERRPLWGEGLEAHRTLRLEPLSRRESRELLGEILQRAAVVPEVLVAVVSDAAEGNPYYIEEMVKWFMERGVIDTSDEQHWVVAEDRVSVSDVPTTLTSLLQARLDSLDRDERMVIEPASVLGRVFWDDAVARLRPPRDRPTDLASALHKLREREVVFQRPRSTFEGTLEFSFKHALLRDVAYASVLRAVRRSYHRLAAQWLTEVAERSGRLDEFASVIGAQFEGAGDTESAAVWHLRAGIHASSTFANRDALRLLGQAEELAPARSDLVFDVLLARETVLDRVGDRRAQRAALDALAEADPAADVGRRAERLLAEGRWDFTHNDYERAHRLAEEAAALASEDGRRDLEVSALLLSGRSLVLANKHHPARAVLGQAVAKGREIGASAVVAESLRNLAMIAQHLSEHDEARALLEQSRAYLRDIGDVEGEARVAGQLGANLAIEGKFDEARLPTEEFLERAVIAGDRRLQSHALGNLGAIVLELGELGSARGHAEEALRLCEELGDREGTIVALVALGEVARLAGDNDRASTLLERAADIGLELEAEYHLPEVYRSLALTALAQHRPAQARDHAASGRRWAVRAGLPGLIALTTLVEGLVLVDTEEPVLAVETLREAMTRNAELDREAGRLESGAALAAALVATGEAKEGRDLAAAIVSRLDARETRGRVDPPRMFRNCYRALVASTDPLVDAVALAAAEFVHAAAARIDDPGLRRGYLDSEISVELLALR